MDSRHVFGAIVVIWIVAFLFVMGAVIPMISSLLLGLQP
jgi:hypothetical protein